MTTNTFVPSAFQSAFFSQLESNIAAKGGDIMLVAKAGSGKSKSIEEAVRRLPAHLIPRTLITAFNKHIQTEMRDRQRRGDIPQGVTISTIHGLGTKVVANAFEPKLPYDIWIYKNKYRDLVDIYFDQTYTDPERRNEEDVLDAARSACEAVRLCMITLTDVRTEDAILETLGHYGVEYPSSFEQTILNCVPVVMEWGMKGLPNKAFAQAEYGTYFHPSERISYDDMIFLPIALDLKVPTFTLCFIDEAQDFNRAQQELLLRARGRGIAVWVGDPQQSIYGFTGADPKSFARIQELTGATSLPLSICYRCSKAVIRHAQTIVPDILHADNAVEGMVMPVAQDALVEIAATHFQSGSKKPFMLLCRTTAPLVTLAFDFLKRGVPAKVKGRDIGEDVIKTIDAIAKQKYEETTPAGVKSRKFTFAEFPTAAEQYRMVQVQSLAQRKDTEMLISRVNDMVDSALAVYEWVSVDGGREIGDLRSKVQSLFADETGVIALSTIHKAKGLEADNVGIIRTDLMPHPMAKQDWEMEQEVNLQYVAVTRARVNLYLSAPAMSAG